MRLFPSTLGLAVLLGSTASSAQPEPPEGASEEPATPETTADAPAPPKPVPPPAPVPPPPPSVSYNARNHDGFYLRLATGFGAYTEDLRSEDTPTYGGEVTGSSTGFATLGEIAAGGTVARGLVLGAGAYTAQLVSATARTDAESPRLIPSELDPTVRNFTIVGPFVDWYFHPRRGFHAQAAIGLATFSGIRMHARVYDEERYHAGGAGIMLGVGHEWWIGDEWSMGIMGRVQGAYLVGKDGASVGWGHAVGVALSPMFTVTYH